LQVSPSARWEPALGKAFETGAFRTLAALAVRVLCRHQRLAIGKTAIRLFPLTILLKKYFSFLDLLLIFSSGCGSMSLYPPYLICAGFSSKLASGALLGNVGSRSLIEPCDLFFLFSYQNLRLLLEVLIFSYLLMSIALLMVLLFVLSLFAGEWRSRLRRRLCERFCGKRHCGQRR